MSGIELVARERERQVAVEGWSFAHDDSHTLGELTSAASAYAEVAVALMADQGLSLVSLEVPYCWPWDAEWWKPSSEPIRNLVKAASLLVAEIDRLQRANTTSEEPHKGEGGE